MTMEAIRKVFLRRFIGNQTGDELASQECSGTIASAPANSPYTYMVYRAMSNELSTPKVAVCPGDNRSASNPTLPPTLDTRPRKETSRCFLFCGNVG